MQAVKNLLGVVFLLFGGLIVWWQVVYLHTMFTTSGTPAGQGVALFIAAPFVLIAVVLIGFGLVMMNARK